MLNLPKNARGTKGDGQYAVNPVGREDKLLSLCLGLVVGIEWLFGERHSLVNIDEILTVEDHTSGTSIDELWNFVFLGSGNDSLGTVYVYLPIECGVLNTRSW